MIDPKAVQRSGSNLTVAQTANPKAITQPERRNYYAMHKCRNAELLHHKFRPKFYTNPFNNNKKK